MSTGKRPAHGGADTGSSGDTGAPVGSVWWAELGLGACCWLAATVLIFISTAVGPFAAVTVTYPTPVVGLYLVASAALGALFVRSGLDGMD